MENPLVRWLRIVKRGTVFFGTLAYFAAAYALNPGNRRDLAARAFWLHRITCSIMKILGAKSVQKGLPPKGTLIVANHISYLDIIVISASMPVVFVAKSEVRGWPIFGWFAQLAGTRFIDRKHRGDVVRIADGILPALEAGVSVVLFLEGTSSDGGKVLPFKASLLEPAARGGLAVTPAAIGYKAPPGHRAATEICWWGDMTLAPHLVNLFSLEHIDASLAWGETFSATEDRKALALELHAQVSALHASLGSVS
ncbi:MAG: lysophospholipid acyltransferase family protein [Opitutaceae bacterium]|jgi:1-acyl-sn-glycerol-3-phosphate acyltransferase